MSITPTFDDDLVRRLPLPLAQLYRRAHNAKTPLERHLTAYFLWEAALKLLGSVAIVAYADQGQHDPEITERLRNLARPSLGHWREFVRLLLPKLAAGDAGFRQAADLLGRTRDDLPRAAGLDATLRDALDGQSGARSTVRLDELFDRLVRYRNRELGHGAAGQASEEVYERVGAHLLVGLAELLGRLDVLAGRRLLFVGEVRRQGSGDWVVERYELTGENPRRLPVLVLPSSASGALPHPERVYLSAPPRADGAVGEPGGPLRSLHPLVLFESETAEAFFLNARRGAQRGEYLCYASGRVADRRDAGSEQREFLAQVLGMTVDEAKVGEWAARSQSEEPPTEAREETNGSRPRRIGEFEIVSELGRGGMGVVYRAWQPSLGRQVALKTMLRSGDPKAEARFGREIRALGKVDHPHLVRIFASGSEGDRWFYAMELIDGVTLGSLCEKLAGTTATAVGVAEWRQALTVAYEEERRKEVTIGDDGPEPRPGPPRPPTAAARPTVELPQGHVVHVVEMMCQAADAAHALHEVGVVHRDIKPGNLLLTPDGAHVVLMDLGLAQLADEAQGKLTRTRQFVGTLRYASPEQVLAVGGLDRAHGHLQPGRDAVGNADASAALWRDRSDAVAGNDAADPDAGPGAGAQVQPARAARPGSDCAEMPGEGPEAALRHGPGTGGRSSALPQARAGAGPADWTAPACNSAGAAAAGGGDRPRSLCHRGADPPGLRLLALGYALSPQGGVLRDLRAAPRVADRHRAC